MNNDLPISIIIFGASGDLTQRKLIPSLLHLSLKGRLSKNFHILGFGGTAFTDEQFREHLGGCCAAAGEGRIAVAARIPAEISARACACSRRRLASTTVVAVEE